MSRSCSEFLVASVSKDEKNFVLVAWAFSWPGTELIQEYYNSTTGEYKKTNKEMTITDLPCYPI